MIAFSNTGEQCTEFERTLLAGAQMPNPNNVREQWVSTGKRIGAENLVVVLDEFAGIDKIYVPTRRSFFADLYRPLRIEMARVLRLQEGLSVAQIAKRLGISERTADSDLCAAFGGTPRR